MTEEKVEMELVYPKDEKLARKSHGKAAAGSMYLCTYCDATRQSVIQPPHLGSIPVTLTNKLEEEASYYMALNPGKKSQETLAKHSIGMKESPLLKNDPDEEPPDPLHLDLNISAHLITIACRIMHYGETGTFKYEKGEVERKAVEATEAKYYSKLREKITTLPELTTNPGNFAREFCNPKNENIVSDPLPECHEKTVWVSALRTWSALRSIHRSNSVPSAEEIIDYTEKVSEFQSLLYSLTWVPPANQVHRLTHVAFFMNKYKLVSIGAMALEGLEHGNFTTKLLEQNRIWRGDIKVGNKQLFRALRCYSSPTLRRISRKMNVPEKIFKCSSCKQKGHRRNSNVCPNFNQDHQEQLHEEELVDVDIGHGADSEDDARDAVGMEDDPEAGPSVPFTQISWG